jgi:hypothetical protein
VGRQRFANLWRTTLTAAATDADLVLHVSASEAAKLPAMGAGDWLVFALDDDTGTVEFVRCTAVDSGTGELTVERHAEGSSPVAWPLGSIIRLDVTAGALAALYFDPDSILTAGGDVLVGANGNVLTQEI